MNDNFQDGFIPSYITTKGFCTWKDRREKGVSRAQAQSMVKDLKQRLPEDLKEHIKEPNLRGMMSHAVRVDTAPTKTLEIRGCLQDIIRNDDVKVNGIQPFVVAERPMKVQQRYRRLGQPMEAIKGTAEKLGGGFEAAPDWQSFACYLTVPSDERPRLIGEMDEDCVIKLNGRDVTMFLKMEAPSLLAMAMKDN